MSLISNKLPDKNKNFFLITINGKFYLQVHSLIHALPLLSAEYLQPPLFYVMITISKHLY